MHERGDLTVFHEPFLVAYYTHHSERVMPMLDENNTNPQDYDAVQTMLVDAASERPVFFKDMSYYMVPRMVEDEVFSRKLCNVFLIRDPRRTIASYYKLDPEFSLVEVGLEAQWQHFGFLRDELGLKILVIEAEAVANDPQTEIRRMWDLAGLPFVASVFEWNAAETPDAWRYVEGWHGDVLSSTGIHKDETDPDEVFAEVAAKAPHLTGFLAHHQPYYDKLQAQA